MAETDSLAKFTCTQCGGELTPDQGQLFETCPFCGSTVYLDKTRVVFHWYLAPTLGEAEALASLRRWMSGNDTVKDLDKKSRITEHTFSYFPIWQFKSTSEDRQHQVLQPAAATSVSELRRLHIPGGDLRRYDPALDLQAVQPSVPYEAARGWAQQHGIDERAPVEAALVHLPLHTFKYEYNRQTYTALVEASTGAVFANEFPAKAEAPYALAAIFSIGGFLILALIPIFGAMIASDPDTLFSAIGICIGLALPFGAVSFLLASWVAAKV